jgi:hypothetical protein
VTEGHPWDEYRKAKLPRGWAYPLGQARIAEALKDAGAAVGFLSLGRPDLPPKSGPLTVFDVVWLGDAAAGYFGPVGSGRGRLLMRWTAVPAADRSEVVRQLDDGILRRGCEWTAAAFTRGNAWAATEHRFWVTYGDGQVQVSEA